MNFFQPQSLRSIQDFVNRTIKKWEGLTDEEKKSGEYINPDEPIVLRVPNPEWEEGEDGPYEPDDDGNETHICFHVISHGGGGDMNEYGEECGHDGPTFTGMEMDRVKFDYNGRRLKK